VDHPIEIAIARAARERTVAFAERKDASAALKPAAMTCG
jgi:hypothetical protein